MRQKRRNDFFNTAKLILLVDVRGEKAFLPLDKPDHRLPAPPPWHFCASVHSRELTCGVVVSAHLALLTASVKVPGEILRSSPRARLCLTRPENLPAADWVAVQQAGRAESPARSIFTKGPHKSSFGTKASVVYHRVHNLLIASFLHYPMVFERLRNSHVRTERASL